MQFLFSSLFFHFVRSFFQLALVDGDFDAVPEDILIEKISHPLKVVPLERTYPCQRGRIVGHATVRAHGDSAEAGRAGARINKRECVLALPERREKNLDFFRQRGAQLF